MEEVIIGLLGVVVGWALTTGTTWFQATQTKRQQSQGIRIALVHEVQMNVLALKVMHTQPGATTHTWTRQVWNSQLATLPTLLNSAELYIVGTFYYALELLVTTPRPEAVRRAILLGEKAAQELNSNLPSRERFVLPEILQTPDSPQVEINKGSQH